LWIHGLGSMKSSMINCPTGAEPTKANQHHAPEALVRHGQLVMSASPWIDVACRSLMLITSVVTLNSLDPLRLAVLCRVVILVIVRAVIALPCLGTALALHKISLINDANLVLGLSRLLWRLFPLSAVSIDDLNLE
jgi:hypothetical protein